LTTGKELIDYKILMDSVKDVEKENEILHGKLSVQEKALNNQHEMITKLQKMQKRISDDLELSPTSYRNTTTRSLAEDAFEQSTVKANWEGLGKHPVIEDIYKEINNRSSTEGRRADDVLRKLETQMSVEDFFDQLSKSSEVLEIKEALHVFDSSLGDLRITLNSDRTHANEHDLEQREKIADMQTAIDLIDFLQSELVISYDGAFIFLMGALAEMGKGQVEEGLRFMLRKPKVEKIDGEKITETPE